MKCVRLGVVCVGLLALSVPLEAAPLSTSFSYQGQLKLGGVPISGLADFEFSLWDQAALGAQIGATQTKLSVGVQNGLFAVELDFGASAFTGSERWLQVTVRHPAGVGNYVSLDGRERIAAAPYSLFSLNTFWQASGNAISNTNSGFVGINRSSAVNNVEYFGIQAASTGTEYGGMYVRTNGTNAKPFYGYASGSGLTSQTAWTYLDGATGDWHIHNGDDRITVTDTGNVGIGVTSPGFPLDVNGRVRFRQTGSTAGIWFYQTTPAADRAFVGMYDDNTVGLYGGTGAGWGLLMNTTSGDVGIDTATPQGRLQIVNGTDSEPSGGGFLIVGATGGANISVDNNEIMGRNNGAVAPLYLNNDGGNVHMAVAGGGVSIGTTTIPTGVRLAVDGKVLCEELEVQLSQDWPDFVFDKSYSLMPLDEVERSIAEHGHLPGIPSAADVAARGLNVGQMQAQTLQKIEELTLHMIELDKRLRALEQENQDLRERLSASGGVR